MKKLYNIFDASYPESKFNYFMDKCLTIAFWIGISVFASIAIRFSYLPIINFAMTHSINFTAIWADISIWLCLWLISVCFLVIWAANNYRISIREDYLVRTTSKLIALNNEIDELKAANKILRESNARLFDRTPAARKRNLKGQFLPKA